MVEYQKWGLSHARMLIWLDPAAKSRQNADIESFVYAEIFDELVDRSGDDLVSFSILQVFDWVCRTLFLYIDASPEFW